MPLADSSAKGSLPLPFTGVRYDDLDVFERYASPTEQYATKGGRAFRNFRLKQYDARWDFAAYMLGWSDARYSDTGQFQYISRVLPEVYKPTISRIAVKVANSPIADDWGRVVSESKLELIDKDKPWLWASSIESVRGCGKISTTYLPNLPPGESSFTTYDEAEVRVGYEVRHYRLVDDNDLVDSGQSRLDTAGGQEFFPDEMYAGRYCSFHPQPSTLSMSVPKSGMEWDASAPVGVRLKPAHNDMFRLKRSVDIQLRWYGVPGLPVGLFDQLTTVNDRSWEIRPPGHRRLFAPHTLLYLGYKLHSYRQITGGWVHDISLLFSHFEEGHNKELAFQSGAESRYSMLVFNSFDETSPTYLNHLLYSESNFANLFRLPDLT